MKGRVLATVAAAAATVLLGSISSAEAQPSGRFATYSQDVFASQPSAFYPFNESGGSTAVDATGNGNDATYNGPVTYGQQGVFADGSVQAIGLTGDSDTYAADTNDLSELEGSADRTVELWFNTTDTSSMSMFRAGAEGSPDAAFTISLMAPGSVTGPYAPSGAGVYVQFFSDDIAIPFPNLTDGNWHYVAVTVSDAGNLVNVVIDGQEPSGSVWNGTTYTMTPVSQTASSPSGFQMPSAVDTQQATFAFGSAGWSTNFTGSLDLGAIYPTALTPSVLEAHYLAGTGPTPAVIQVSPSSGPASGGTSVTVTGTGFTDASQVEFGATAVSFVLDSPTQLTAASPPGTGGADVTVTTPTGTSATGTADVFSYLTVPPLVSGGTPSVTSPTSAALNATVNPEGLPTTVQFEYGPVLPDTAFSYTGSTASQSLGPDFSDHVVSATAVGLLPNTTYRVQAVATNSAGSGASPVRTLTTPADHAPPPPILGQSFNVRTISGLVLVKVPHGGFVPLTELKRLPSGTEVDARLGSLELITSNGEKGKTQHGTFGGAIFKLTQTRSGATKGLVTLSIVENAFKGAPSYALCTKHPAGEASAAALSSKTLQLLHASGHGKFRTSGRYSAATVRGTIWTIADRCDGTLVHDVTDSVSVTDFVHHKTIILHSGQSYLAKAPHA
ncbi:MAG TPA: IPT/TIG domain-containing protein [Solirubrobacteraceae bacterium]